MLTHPTLDQLRALRLEGMARALEEQHAHPAIEALTFDERLAQLIDRELLLRDGKRIERLLERAHQGTVAALRAPLQTDYYGRRLRLPVDAVTP